MMPSKRCVYWAILNGRMSYAEPSKVESLAAFEAEVVAVHTYPSGMKVFYTSQGYADNEPGQSLFRAALRFIAKMGIMESLEREHNAIP